MEQKKKFEPFDKIIIRPKIECGIWYCAIFSHYSQDDENYFFIIGGDIEGYSTVSTDVLHFAGNKHLVGTTDMPDEEVELKKGDVIVTFDDLRDIEKPFYVNINEFKDISEKYINFCKKDDKIIFVTYSKYCIPFSRFNPNDMKETRKHILCVKNGKLVRAFK